MTFDRAGYRTEAGLGPMSRWQLDAVVAVLSLLMVVGVALDFRRHALYGVSFAEEGFFTTEHVFFYSMFLAIAAVLGAATVLQRRKGASWVEAVPTGYGWGVVGVVIFGLGGLGDLAWHTAFGFEESTEALVSPSHLALALGAGLFLASPFRSAWHRGEARGVRSLPVVISAGLVTTLIALFTLFFNPLAAPYPHFVPPDGDGAILRVGIAATITYPLIYVGTVLVLARRFDLPPGAYTLVFLAPALASSAAFNHFEYAWPAVTAGIVADGLARWRRPTPDDTLAARLVAALVPMTFVATYHAVIELGVGVAWTTHVWAGSIVMAGMLGLLLSVVATAGET